MESGVRRDPDNDEFEFNEQDLYGAGDESHQQQESTIDDDSGSFGVEECVFVTSEGLPEGSGKSCTILQDIHEDEPTDMVGESIKLASSRLHGNIIGSLSVQSAVRMGSSVPVNIPGGLIPLKSTAQDSSPAQGSEQHQGRAVFGTFIPPHKMSQRDDFLFSITGASPGAGIKRDRLRVRNEIFKLTGFLENHTMQENAVEKNRQSTGAVGLPPAGGLSQALNAPS